MQKTVPGAHLEQVAALAGKLGPRLGNGLVTGWRSATDLTANRVGLILANDLESAAKAIATETSSTSGLPVKERLRDLLAYAASESYFAVRRHLGLTVRAEASAGCARRRRPAWFISSRARCGWSRVVATIRSAVTA
jgi:hypothetical protein